MATRPTMSIVLSASSSVLTLYGQDEGCVGLLKLRLAPEQHHGLGPVPQVIASTSSTRHVHPIPFLLHRQNRRCPLRTGNYARECQGYLAARGSDNLSKQE